MARATALIAASATAVVLLSGLGQAAEPIRNATCDNKSASVLFWPNAKPPHVEIYGGLHQDTFPKKTRAYAEPTQLQINTKACNTVERELASGKVPNSRRRTKATNFQCRFGQKMRIVFAALGDGVRVTIVRKDGTKVIDLKIVGNGSSAVFDKERCEAKAPPK